MKIDLLQAAREGAADTQCLLQDRWDFHWQRSYTYDAPIEALPVLHAGDKLALRCTYDNSMGNERLATEYRARGLTLSEIVLGEKTTDEMCLAIPRVLLPAR